MSPDSPRRPFGASLTDGVVDRLTGRIVDGGFAPGDKLPSEGELMEQFAVSRTVVREALSRLQAAGLVETYRGRGTFVLTRPSEEAFSIEAGSVRTVPERLELLDFRIAVEVEAASLAAQRRTPAQLDEIARALDVFRASRAKPSGAVDADFRFHTAIAAAASNRYYAELLTSLGPTIIAMPQTRLRAAEGPERDAHFDRVTYEHESIYAAIERGDPAGAAAAVRTHLANSRQRLTLGPDLG
ncbi:FadR/GntR family transcriptional regulator [Sinomonas sp. ASV486]|uniref:FadR/GntR family transcriptional regulator n=1 Tax=Sinomonas sp. ASV486 TaxID=3051170 RepID=UPI0027DC47C3|nr:FadR/GntR family transcriptional regulator [Sinomonas sp. ASV486]MDQ4489511.1 FadR/GntR family transcriptional regulator [Sinomonas sp. ASV486]